jgi:hypothetical protein
MQQPLEPMVPDTTWSYDVGRAIKRGDWSKLASLILIEAGQPVLRVVGLFACLVVLAWIATVIRDSFTRDDLLSLAIATPIVLAVAAAAVVAIVVAIAALVWVGYAAVIYWQMTVILVLIGGFMGGGTGALVGGVLSGLIGKVINYLKSNA